MVKRFITLVAVLTLVALLLSGLPAQRAEASPDWVSPTTSVTPNQFTNPDNAFTSDNSYATVDTNNNQQGYGNFGIPTIPAGSTIDGIQVAVEAKADWIGPAGNRYFTVQLSWDGGVSFTIAKTTLNFGKGEDTQLLGRAMDKWERTWLPGEFANSSFRVRLGASLATGHILYLDHLQVKVYYTPPPPSEVWVITATSTGAASFSSDVGQIKDLTAVDEGTLPPEGKPNLVFPHGFFSFNITGLTPGQTVIVTITLPSDVPVGTRYWKYHASEGGWIQIPMGDDDGDNVINITLVDGGLGDDDGIADGVIVDQGGPGSPPPVVGGEVYPINKATLLMPWLGLAFVLILAVGGGALALRRRRSQ